MKSKLINIIYFVAGALVAFAGFKAYESEKAPIILTKDHIIRDSIFIVNDSIKKEFIYVIREIDKEKDTVLNNSDSANLVFFSNYLNECDLY